MNTPVIQRLRALARSLEQQFLGRQETIRLMVLSVLAGEHIALVGPPGTAKSALVRTFARAIDSRYFEYLLTRFTEPNELFGPVDIPAFRQGTYRRRTEGMMPEAEIVFLDEIFKSNSAILNALLTLLNERKFNNGSTVVDVPLLSVFGASNEVPADESLQAIFDRFLLRVRSEHLDAYHFQELVNRGVTLELEKLGAGSPPQIFLTTKDLVAVRPEVARRMQLSDELLATYKSLVFQIRAEGVSLSDRRVVKLIKLMAASAYFDGRPAADVSDLFILKHVWNTLEQSEILDAIVSPVLDGYFRSHPEARRAGGMEVGLDALLMEVQRIKATLTAAAPVSDLQLFAHLRALGEIKAALQSLATDPARRALVEVDQLLEHVFRSGRISG
ncbi:MAG: AAA family ATPase [Deltaproteobacteria bacterium]|nr:AAA family ATPase [Myxococcales bacterium]MDP3213826.1 AAA family ATPase [Deltaproteobacteria bacterium]